jgi:hypothetical protein
MPDIVKAYVGQFAESPHWAAEDGRMTQKRGHRMQDQAGKRMTGLCARGVARRPTREVWDFSGQSEKSSR